MWHSACPVKRLLVFEGCAPECGRVQSAQETSTPFLVWGSGGDGEGGARGGKHAEGAVAEEKQWIYHYNLPFR